MKMSSVQQPFATLLSLGYKGNETRSWPTKHRGQTGIHASKKIDKESCRREPIKSVLAAHGYDELNLPTGCVIAIGNLANCLKVIEDARYCALLEDGQVIEGNEYEFGWYEPGRFAWRFEEMRQIKPVPAKGQLSFWNWEGEYEWLNNTELPRIMKASSSE